MEAPELGGAERGTAHGGASETMMLVRGMHLSVYLYRCICIGVSVYLYPVVVVPVGQTRQL